MSGLLVVAPEEMPAPGGVLTTIEPAPSDATSLTRVAVWQETWRLPSGDAVGAVLAMVELAGPSRRDVGGWHTPVGDVTALVVPAGVERPQLCFSQGPRIGGEGAPVCKQVEGHDGTHRPAADDGWGGITWGAPDWRRHDAPTAVWWPATPDLIERLTLVPA